MTCFALNPKTGKDWDRGPDAPIKTQRNLYYFQTQNKLPYISKSQGGYYAMIDGGLYKVANDLSITYQQLFDNIERLKNGLGNKPRT